MLGTGAVGFALAMAAIMTCLAEHAKDLPHTTSKFPNTVSQMTPIW